MLQYRLNHWTVRFDRSILFSIFYVDFWYDDKLLGYFVELAEFLTLKSRVGLLQTAHYSQEFCWVCACVGGSFRTKQLNYRNEVGDGVGNVVVN